MREKRIKNTEYSKPCKVAKKKSPKELRGSKPCKVENDVHQNIEMVSKPCKQRSGRSKSVKNWGKLTLKMICFIRHMTHKLIRLLNKEYHWPDNP